MKERKDDRHLDPIRPDHRNIWIQYVNFVERVAVPRLFYDYDGQCLEFNRLDGSCS